MIQEDISYTNEEVQAMSRTIQELRREKKEWIDKACEWLEPVFKNYAGYNCGIDLVKNFRKVMGG